MITMPSSFVRRMLMGCLACACVGTVHAQATVKLRPMARITNAHVTLNDIAELSSPQLAVLQQLMALPLGAAPSPGREVVWRRTEIERRLRQRMPQAGGQIALSGPDEIEVVAAAQPVSGDRVLQVAQLSLESWLRARVTQFDINALADPQDLEVPTGELRLTARPLPASTVVARRVMVWVDIAVNERFIKSVPVRFEVNATQQAWVATETMAPNEAARTGAYVQTEVDATRNSGPMWSGPSADVPVRSRHAVAAGTPVTQRDVEPVPEVTRGSSALLRTKSGAVAIESRVEVLQDGRRGQHVRIKTPFSNGPLTALVSGPGQLEITER